jgi:hypothetical protein
MSSRRIKDDPHEGKDKIPIESPDSSDVDMDGHQRFDSSRQRRKSCGDDGREPRKMRVRDDAKSHHTFEPDNTHSRASSNPSNNRFIPGLSSYGSQTETIRPQYQPGLLRDAPYGKTKDSFNLSTRSRGRSPSPRASSFSASQASTAYDHPPSPTRESSTRTRRSRHRESSDTRSRSRCRNPLASPSERQQHGCEPRPLWLHNPTGETLRREIIIKQCSDDGKERRRSSSRRK